MRLFTAIDLPAEIVERFDSLLEKLRPLAKIGWSKTENLHITTKFIGQWPEDRLPQLTATMRQLPSRAPIPIRLHGLGFFPNKKSPRVFWAGVDAPPELSVLASDTDSAVARLGVEPESRVYSPHLTLARIKTSSDVRILRNEVERLGNPECGSYQADRFYLYLSKPGPAGSVYTKLSEFPFSTQ